MNDNNIIKTNFITSVLNQNAKQFYIISFIIIVVSIGLISSEPDNKMKNNMDGMNMPGMDMANMKHPINFGPGDAFHIHKKTDPEKYEHVADISKPANDLPTAFAKNQGNGAQAKW